MFKKTITYVDYNGIERTEDFYFNLNKAEILELEMSVEGGLSAWGQAMINSHDTTAMMDLFKKIITSAYGVKSPDGRKFIKNDTVLNDFTQTEAYSELMTEFLTNTDSIAEFFNALVTPVAKSATAPNVNNLVQMPLA